jgi:prevent-host-death family protein
MVRSDLYGVSMSDIAVSGACGHLEEVIESATRLGEPVYLTRHGKPVAVVVDPDVFQRLLRDAEDAVDRAELELVREDNDYIPWEQVKADLPL